MDKNTRRDTKQRKYICQVVEEAGRPLSPQEILKEAQVFLPSLGIATVYRSVKYLTEEGVFQTVDLPGEGARYELAGKHHHHHFHCQKCGKLYEIDCCIDADMHNLPPGFSVKEHVVILYGCCNKCQTAEKAENRPADEAEPCCQCACHKRHEHEEKK